MAAEAQDADPSSRGDPPLPADPTLRPDTTALELAIARTLGALTPPRAARSPERQASVLLPLLLGPDLTALLDPGPSAARMREAASAPGRGATQGPGFVGIVRSDQGRHGGQFGLPGGGHEPDDRDAWHTAWREACEEVGFDIAPRPLGVLGEYRTYVSGYRVQVHVACVDPPSRWRPQPGEVEAILRVPLDALLPTFANMPRVDDVRDLPIEQGFEFDPHPYLQAGRLPPRGRGHRLETPDGPRAMPFVWGLTARILYDFLRLVWMPAQGRSA